MDVAPEDLAGLHEVERDAHGHLRIAEVNIGEILKAKVNERLKQLGIKATTVAKNIGYELRCADPIPYDNGVRARSRLLRREVSDCRRERRR